MTKLTLCVVAAVALTGCGSDSSAGPKPLTAAQAAAHYDSLVGALYQAGTSTDTIQAALVGFISGAAAYGAAPANAAVTLDGNKSTWYATAVNLVDSAKTDSVQLVVLWSDLSADDIVAASFSTSALPGMLSYSAGGDLNTSQSATGSALFGAASGTCTLTNIVNTYNPILMGALYNPSATTCLPQPVTITATATFPADTTTTGSIESISFNAQNMAAVRVQANSDSTLYASRVPARLRALALHRAH